MDRDTWGPHHEWTQSGLPSGVAPRQLAKRAPRRGRRSAKAGSDFDSLSRGMIEIARKAAAGIDFTLLLQTRSLTADAGAEAPDISSLYAVVQALQEEVRRQREEIDELKAARVPRECRDLPKDALLSAVAAYYEEHKGENIYPSDVAEALNLDAFAVYEATNELVSEGRLE